MKVSIITKPAEFLSLKREWNSLMERCHHPSVFISHEWFKSWWEAFGEDFKLSVYRIKEENRIVGFAPFMRNNNALFFLAGEEVTDYCDFIFEEDDTDIFFNALLQAVQSGGNPPQRLELINIRGDSPSVIGLTRNAARNGIPCVIFPMEVAPVLELPDSYERYLSSLERKKRHELRRKIRRAGELPELRVRSAHGSGDQLDGIEDFIVLHRSSGSGKQEFWEKKGTEDFFRAAFQGLSEKGWARMDSPVSYTHLTLPTN